MATARNHVDSTKFSKYSAVGFKWKEFACGWGAAFINITVTFPINKVMFRQVFKQCTAFQSSKT